MEAKEPEDQKSLYGQIRETKERVAAWAFRGLTTIVMMALAIIGWFVQDKLGSFNDKFDQINTERAAIWKTIGDQATSQKCQSETMVRIETTLTDHIATENNILQTLTSQQQQLDERERTLEQKVH